MNKARRKTLEELAGKLDAVRAGVEEARDEEQDYFDNMPESFQDGEKGDIAQQAIETLDEALDGLETAYEAIQTAMSS